MPFISDEELARFAELCQRAHQHPPMDSVRLLFNPYWAFSPPMQEPSDVACRKSFVWLVLCQAWSRVDVVDGSPASSWCQVRPSVYAVLGVSSGRVDCSPAGESL